MPILGAYVNINIKYSIFSTILTLLTEEFVYKLVFIYLKDKKAIVLSDKGENSWVELCQDPDAGHKEQMKYLWEKVKKGYKV